MPILSPMDILTRLIINPIGGLMVGFLMYLSESCPKRWVEEPAIAIISKVDMGR
jgi:hypothetical protein